jgi:hypothetical protein
LGNRFDFANIAETMEYSDEDSDYPEAPNEVNDENQNSPSYNDADVPADTNGRVINETCKGKNCLSVICRRSLKLPSHHLMGLMVILLLMMLGSWEMILLMMILLCSPMTFPFNQIKVQVVVG